MSKRLSIELDWVGGILTEEDRFKPPAEPRYELRVIVPGTADETVAFDSCLALERFIAARHADAGRVALPPAPADEAARLHKAFALLDNPPEGFDTSHLRSTLAGMLYQWSHPPETVARLRRELGLPPPVNV